MSRPRLSVPSGNAASWNGGARKESRNCSAGPCGAIQGAAAATATRAAMMTSPANAPRLSSSRRAKPKLAVVTVAPTQSAANASAVALCQSAPPTTMLSKAKRCRPWRTWPSESMKS